MQTYPQPEQSVVCLQAGIAAKYGAAVSYLNYSDRPLKKLHIPKFP